MMKLIPIAVFLIFAAGLDAAGPNNYEQYLLELINRGRADPAAEAARYGIDLNEGLPAGTISSDPKQPLAANGDLIDGARAHSQWMIDNDVFSHTGAGGSSPGDRMAAAGYDFRVPWAWGENIAWFGTTAPSLNPLTTTANLHEGLFVDTDIEGRGHRVNQMNPSYREIGLGIVLGNFEGYNAEMITEDFAFTTTPGVAAFLTGVVYNDTLVTQNSFYTPGEGLGDVTITATRASDAATFQTTTWSSGGYSLAVPAGTYVLTAQGGDLSPNLVVGSATIGSSNVKVDFTEDNWLSPVYRFWSDTLSGHFYTISAAERDKLISRYSSVWHYESPAFYAYAPGHQPTGTIPVYRFWSAALEGHFYTTSAGEKDKLISQFRDVWAYEGPAFYVYAESPRPSETLPVYRFWSQTLGHHFYTISAAEYNKLINTYPDVWEYELIAWYTYPYTE
jgi:hypothetical protein